MPSKRWYYRWYKRWYSVRACGGSVEKATAMDKRMFESDVHIFDITILYFYYALMRINNFMYSTTLLYSTWSLGASIYGS